MENIIIIFILILLMLFALIHTLRHLKGKGGCCGGGSYKPSKKTIKNVLYKKTYIVKGMNCEHCKARVEEKINDISGISGKVDLKRGRLTVKFAKDVPDEVIKSAVEKAGYKLQ